MRSALFQLLLIKYRIEGTTLEHCGCVLVMIFGSRIEVGVEETRG